MENADDDKTVKQGSQSFEEVNSCRVSLVIKLPASTDPRAKCRTILKSLITQARKVDPNFAILPWANRSEEKPLAKASAFPVEYQDLQAYFPQLAPRVKNHNNQTLWLSTLF